MSCITINCGCCENEKNSVTPTPVTGDGTPIGTVIAYMGTKAPLHYLICNGAVLNIADYQALSDQILDEFGAVNYFGGDGTTTFALPDLRNEFLRGYHGESAEQLSGEIGIHQEATEHLNLWGRTWLQVGHSTLNDGATSKNVDKYVLNDKGPGKGIALSSSSDKSEGNFTSRPTNIAVLYCIKYE